MNIFATDPNPITSAENLDTLRVNKMILESVQMLAVALAENGCPKSDLPIKKDGTLFRVNGWSNHPCTVWVKASRANYLWLVAHTNALINEMIIRTGTRHSASQNMPRLISGAQYIPQQGLTDFANCSGENQINIFESYKTCLSKKWKADKRAPKWGPRQKPSWA